MPLGGLLDRQRRADDRAHPTVGDHRPHRFDDRGDDRGFAVRAVDGTGPQRGADDAGALAHQLADVELALDAALHTDDDDLPVGGQSVDIAVQVGRTHDVEDDVGAGRLFLDARDEILVAVTDRQLGAQFAAQIEFGLRARRHRHRDAERAGDLDGVRADAAGSAVQQQHLAAVQMCGHHQVRPDRARHLR